MPFPTVQNHTSVGGLQTSISESSSPVFPENEFSLDFLFLLVVCSSEQRISPRPISAILERVSCLAGVKMPILQALQAKADRFKNPKSGSLSTNS